MGKPTRQGVLADLALAYPRQSVQPGTFATYMRELDDVPLPLLEEAVRAVIRTHEWFPTVSEIRRQAAEIVLRLPSDSEALAQVDSRMAWGRDQQDCAPAVHPAVRGILDLTGGFAALRGEETGRARSAFLRMYRDERARLVREWQSASHPQVRP